MANAVGRELNWDDEIENESSWVLLPEGEYDFVVEKFERGRHEGSAKVPPCPKAILTLGMDSPTGEHASVTCNLFLYDRLEWKLCQFFTSIGARKHGERLKMNWSQVPGARGRCKIKIHPYTKKNGEPGQGNEVDEFLEPAKGPSKWQKGVF